MAIFGSREFKPSKDQNWVDHVTCLVIWPIHREQDSSRVKSFKFSLSTVYRRKQSGCSAIF